MKDRIAPYKYPRWIEFVPELPKTATGKIQRFKLRQERPAGCIRRGSSSRALAAALLIVIVGAPGPAAARSPLVAELETLAVRYHENPARLGAVRDGLAQAAPRDADAETWTALARACFIWGDVRATTPEQKLAAYEQGKDAARRAIELAPRSAMAHLFYGINLGRWGQTRGVLRSAVPPAGDAGDHPADARARPAPARRLRARRERRLRGPRVPRRQPGAAPSAPSGRVSRSTRTSRRCGSAWRRSCGSKGAPAEARKELQAVLDETAPANPAEWSMRDAPEARTLLQAIGP